MSRQIFFLCLLCPSSALHELCSESFFFHQLLTGNDVASPQNAASPSEHKLFTFAKQMQNYIYIIGDATTRECIVIDAAYDPEGVVAAAQALSFNVSGFIATHFHYDHIGSMAGAHTRGMALPGIAFFTEKQAVPAYIHASELAAAAAQNGIEPKQLSPLADGDVIRVGGVEIHVRHTPGHSPGSIVLLAIADGEQRLLITGDTIFPGSCGRLDLPGSSVEDMHESLATKFTDLPADLPLFPGHAYSGPSSTVGRERKVGLLRPFTRKEWQRMMAR